MSTQRYISTSFWDDEWVQTLDLMEKGLYLYFLSNTLTNIAGVYKISESRILFDTGLSSKKFKEIFDKFEKAGKACRYKEYIIIPKWPKHQKWETSAKIKAGIEAILKSLSSELLCFLKEIGYVYPIDRVCIEYDSRSFDESDQKYPSNYSESDSDIDSDSDIIPSGSDEPPEEKPPSKQKTKKAPLRERESVNDMERVEKAYLQNWNNLFSQGRVQTPDPVVNWNQTRKLLKTHFGKLAPEQIILAINNGLNDDWIMNKGYSLGMMLSASTLNKLLNAAQSGQANKIGEDTIKIWNKAREHWDKQGLKPECRNDTMKESDIPEILITFQNYTWDEIKNAIENYAWHKMEAGPGYCRPPQYLSLAGFLKKGVEKYFDDNALDQQFREGKR